MPSSSNCPRSTPLASPPELNPVERIWLDVRKLLGATLPASLDALANATGTILRDYTADTLASLTDYGYTQLLRMHS